jgi:hypothetical protein
VGTSVGCMFVASDPSSIGAGLAGVVGVHDERAVERCFGHHDCPRCFAKTLGRRPWTRGDGMGMLTKGPERISISRPSWIA